MKIFKLFRGERSPELSEGHNALSSAGTAELLLFRESLGEPQLQRFTPTGGMLSGSRKLGFPSSK